MKCFELQELAALKAAGALDRAGLARLEAMIAENPDAAEEVAALQNAIAAYVGATVKPKVPPPSLRSSILSKIASQPQLRSPASGPKVVAERPGFRFVEASEEGWMQTPVPGFKFKVLSIDKEAGYRVLLAELAPGARIPRHIHKHGAEGIYLLSGDLHSEGRCLRAGDFMQAEPGTDHAELWSIEGCRSIIFEPVDGSDFEVAQAHA